MKTTITRILALALVTVFMCLTLVSCGGPNSDPEKAEAALKDAGYTAILTEHKIDIDGIGFDGLEYSINAFKGTDEYLIVYYFEDKDAANDAWDEIKDEVDELKEAAKDEEFDIVIEKSGKMIYYGTKDAIKAAK